MLLGLPLQSVMGKSKKRTPVTTFCCCKSQKRGKQHSHRKFRRQEHSMMLTGNFAVLPIRQWELTSQWDLGGDGKRYVNPSPEDGWYIKLMRK